MKLVQAGGAEWRELYGECVPDSIYQDPRWLELIERVYPQVAVHRLICYADSGGPAWLLPLVEIKPLFSRRPMLISVALGNYGGFLLPRSNPAPLTAEALAPLRRFFGDSAAFALEIREVRQPQHDLMLDTSFARFELALPEDPETLRRKILHHSRRESLRKAERILGVESVFDHPDALPQFQRIYEAASGDFGTPVHPPRWLTTLAQLFPEETRIVLGRYRGRFIGDQLFLCCRGRAVLHYSFTLPEYRHVPVQDKLLWDFCRQAIAQAPGTVLDFGRTRPEPGKLFFKRGWGAAELPLFYSYLLKPGRSVPRIVPENAKMSPAIWVWRRMPRALQRTLGPILRCRIPT